MRWEDALPNLFPLQPLLLLLLEVFLPLQTLLLRLLAGFGLGLFFLKQAGENPTPTFNTPRGANKKTFSQNNKPRFITRVWPQPETGYFPAIYFNEL